MITGWTFRKSERRDFVRIADFRKSFPRLPVEVCDSEYYEWKICGNPIWEGELWVAEDNDRIVGTKSVVPKRMRILGKILVGGEIGDSYTLPEYRGRGIFTVLSSASREKAIQKGIGLIYNTPNNNSRPLYEKKLNHARILSCKLRSMTRPLNINRTLKMKFNNSAFANALTPSLEIASKIALKLAAIEAKKNNIFVSEVSLFPDDIEDLWTRVSSNYDIILVRDKKYLQWRFMIAPGSYLVLIARSRNGRLLGYIVGKISNNRHLQRGSVADFLTDEDDPKVFNVLLLKLIEEFRRNNVDIVSTWAVKGSMYYKTFIKFGFLRLRKVPVLCDKNDLGNEIINGDHKWHFTLSDTDNV